MKKTNPSILIILLLLAFTPIHAEEEESESVDISQINSEQRKKLGIETSIVAEKYLTEQLIAPGEVWVNAYKSSNVTSRISAQIISRHAKMGDKVQLGQRLVTLSSVSMAEAQGELFITDREWQRVRKLGRKVVAEQRYIKAQVARQQAYAKVLAYGMTASQANNLLLKKNASEATGTFDLLSVQQGIVISDDFVIGQVIEPGMTLMQISDENTLWVETRISPENKRYIHIGSKADIYLDKDRIIHAEVSQMHHQMDETTRTLSIRILVDNKQKLLHPGQFVKTAVELKEGKQVIAVPKSSVLLLQGNQTAFVLKNNKLHAQLVETGEVRGDWIEIKNGLKVGDKVVTKEMFLLKSFLLKSQIGDSD